MALSDNLDHVKTQPKIDDLEPKFPNDLSLEESWTSWLCDHCLYFPCISSRVDLDVKCYTNDDLDAYDEFIYPYNLPTMEEFFESMVNVDSSVDDAPLKNKEEEKKMVDHGTYEDSCTGESKNDEDYCYAPLKNDLTKAECLGSFHQSSSNDPLKNKEEHKSSMVNRSRQECHGCYVHNYTDESENGWCCYKDYLAFH